MYFKRIEMHGFKSFADPVTIEFHNGITCIVGPNGSGKSNISDAIRWVLGEQSPKMLRGGKMEEVIFAGTASRKSRGMAEVTLVIDNETGILPVPYSEVAITRRMYRSGESEYSINRNPCRLRDIRELIMDTGIGVDGYSLIGQGKISDIVSNKPESRREIFEEAAGIVMYRAKKADTEKKLEASHANLDRVNDIVGEIESRIDKLREDSEKATEYLELKQRYKALEINITLKNIESIELKNEYLIDDIAETDSELTDAREGKLALDEQLTVGREKIETLEALSGQTRDKLLKSVEEINVLVNKSQLSAEKLSAIEKDETRLQEEIADFQMQIEQETKAQETISQTRQEVETRLSRLTDALHEKTAEHERSAAALSEKTAEIDQGKNDLFTLQNAISTKSAEATSLSNLKGALERRRLQILTEQKESHSAGGKSRQDLSKLEEQKDQILGQLQGFGEAQKQIQLKTATLLVEEKKLAQEVEELSLAIGQLSSRQKTIEEMESNYEGYHSAVRFIMKAKLPGIHGVAAELIKVPSGYEIAIETALSGALQNIVCVDDRAARAAVALLKESKAGRLTFLPMGSIKAHGHRDSSLKNARGFKGYAADCVTFDEQYAMVMEYLLGRVIIVETLEDAIALSKTVSGGLRFVTLEGEIINAAGAITGGSHKNRTANLLERRGEIERLAQRIEKARDRKSRGQVRLAEVRAEMEKAQEEKINADGQFREAELALAKKESEIQLVKSAISELGISNDKQNRELASIEEEQSGAEDVIRKLRDDINRAKEQIETIQQMTEAALCQHDEFKCNIEKISEEIVAARIAVSSCENERANAKASEERAQTALNDMHRQLEKRQGSLEGILAQREAILSGDTGSTDDLRQKQEEKEAIEMYLAELSQERTALNQVMDESAKQKEMLDEKMSMLQGQKYELEIKKAKNEAQLDAYKDKLWEEFEISYIQAIEFKKKEFAMGAAVKENREIKSRIKELGDVNIGAIKEYETVGERYAFLTTQRDDILKAMDALRQIIEDMDKTIRARFKESFNQVVIHFEEVFRELFGGGIAQLRLEDENRPLESGIEIIAQPPGKRLRNINLMSGGEKTMTAIALMFAVLKTKPTPFCILDEIEAALDDANIERFALYLQKFTDIQFALVTHQKATMEHADALYGVTMPEQGISKIISLKLGE